MKEMRNMKTFLIGLMVLGLVLPGKAQNVKVNPDVKVRVNPDVRVKVNPDIQVDIDHDFDFDLDIDPNIDIDMAGIAEEAIAGVFDGFRMSFGDAGSDIDKFEYQETSQEVEIPLTKPGERGTLNVESHNGKVKIIAYSGPTVKVKMTKYEKKVSGERSQGGMRLVSSGGFNFEASEYNNVVKIENEGWNDRVDFEIQVPKNFNIKAETYNNGHIEIDGISGELDVESYNGPITLSNISGSASASTYNGAIEVTFSQVTADAPMNFSTYNGNVDISVPDGTKFSTKMKTNREIYTDFETFSIKETKPVSNKTNNGRLNVKYESWVEGDLNGGGAEIMMKTTNGNIYIRKK